MIVIIPHQDIEIKLISSQKEIIRNLSASENKIVFYPALPLWIKTDFTSPKEAKEQIKKLTIEKPEYDEKEKAFVCPVKIQTEDGDVFGKMNFIYELLCSDCENSLVSKDILARKKETFHLNDNNFPLEVKIFRLGEAASPSPGIYELSNAVWVKLSLT